MLELEEFPIDDASIAIVAVMAVVYIFVLLIGLFAYIMEGLALHRMGKVCGAPYPWLAWIPYANLYALGYVADKDAEVSGRPATHYRNTLPILFVVLSVLSFGLMGVSVAALSSSPEGELSLGPAMLVVLMFLALLVVAVVQLVFEFIALWHIFQLFSPDNAVAFILLSILVSISMPIVLFIASRKTPAAFTENHDYTQGNSFDGTPDGTFGGNRGDSGDNSNGGDGGAYFIQ